MIKIHGIILIVLHKEQGLLDNKEIICLKLLKIEKIKKFTKLIK